MVNHVVLVIQVKEVALLPVVHRFLLQQIAFLLQSLRQLLLLITAIDIPVGPLSVFPLKHL